MSLCTTLASPAAEKGCKPGLTFLENCDSLSGSLAFAGDVPLAGSRLAPPVAPVGPGAGVAGGMLSRGIPLLPALFWLQPGEGVRMEYEILPNWRFRCETGKLTGKPARWSAHNSTAAVRCGKKLLFLHAVPPPPLSYPQSSPPPPRWNPLVLPPPTRQRRNPQARHCLCSCCEWCQECASTKPISWPVRLSTTKISAHLYTANSSDTCASGVYECMSV
jgi:hypothetical protein